MRAQNDYGPSLFEGNDEGWGYLAIGTVLGFIAGVVTFFAVWIYWTVTHGFILGFGLGWLVAAPVGATVGVVVRFLWGAILFIIGLGGLLIFRAVG